MFVGRTASRPLALGAALGSLLLAGCNTPGPLNFEPPQPPYVFGFRGGDGRAVHVATPFERPIQPCPATPGTPGKDRPVLLVPSWQDYVGCSDAPAPWLARQLAEALAASGFRLVDAKELGDDGLLVQGALLTLSLDTGRYRLAPAVLDLSLELHVTTASGLSARRTFFVQSTRARWKAKDAAQEALDDALRRAVHDMAAATLSLSNRYPPPPAPLAERGQP